MLLQRLCIVYTSWNVSTPTTSPRQVQYDEVDEAAMLASSSFPIAPADLIERAKTVLKQVPHPNPFPPSCPLSKTRRLLSAV